MARDEAQAPRRYAHIDAMRALAVMVVIVAHSGLGAVVPGGAGVTVFFVISGFIITHLLLRERESTGRFDIRGFYLRRAFKIVPPLVVIILIPTIVFFMVGGAINWGHVLSQMFFVSNWLYAFGVPEEILPGSRVVWSLSIEEQFYILFALIWLMIIARRRWRRVLCVVAVVAVVVPISLRAWHFVSTGIAAVDRVYAGTDTRIDAIAIGVITAIIYSRIREGVVPQWLLAVIRSPWVILVAMLLFVGTLVYRDEWFRMIPMYAIQSLVAAVVVLNGLLIKPGRFANVYSAIVSWRPIQWIGLASYSLYLVHAPLFVLIEPWTENFSSPVTILIKISTAVIVGVLIWVVVEKPVERLKKRILPIRKTKLVVPT